jgi:hypothetical protein
MYPVFIYFTVDMAQLRKNQNGNQEYEKGDNFTLCMYILNNWSFISFLIYLHTNCCWYVKVGLILGALDLELDCSFFGKIVFHHKFF